MTTPELVKLVQELTPDFLRGLDAGTLRDIVEAADYQCFPANLTILSQGNPARKLMLLLRGQARITFTTEAGQRLVLRWIPVGRVVGWAALLPDACDYFTSTEAAEESRTLTWDHATIRRLATAHPRLWQNAFEIMGSGFGGFLTDHASQSCDTAPQRLARVLFSLAEVFGYRTPRGIEVKIKNEDLAHAANVTLFTASRRLNEWQRDGFLVKSRGKIVLHSAEALLLHAV